MGDNILDVLYEQIELIKINPRTMTTEELRTAMVKRYDIQMQIILNTRFLMQSQGETENKILRREIALLKSFSTSAKREGISYNKSVSKNSVFSEQEIMSEQEAIELIEKERIYESCSQLFMDAAVDKEKELLKNDKLAQFFGNQRSISTSKIVVNNIRRAIKSGKSKELLGQVSLMASEDETIVDTTTKNIVILGLSDRIVQMYKLIRYKQLANRYRKDKCSINQNDEYPTYSEDSDLLIAEYSKAENCFREKAEDIEFKTKKKR